MSSAYIVHLANYSDGVLYVLAAMFLLATAVMLDRIWFLRRAILRGSLLTRRMAGLSALSRDDLEQLRLQAGRQPEAPLLETALRHLDMTGSMVMASRLDESIMLIAPMLDRRLWVLDTIVTLAPLLGLFGTIIGMFHAFSVLASPGHAPAEVTGGVADALVCTAVGILIAMLGLAAFNMLQNQVLMVLHQLDSIKTMILNRTDGALMVPITRGRSAGNVRTMASAG